MCRIGDLWLVSLFPDEEATLENKELDGGEDVDIVEVSWEELLIESDDIPESDTEVVY